MTTKKRYIKIRTISYNRILNKVFYYTLMGGLVAEHRTEGRVSVIDIDGLVCDKKAIDVLPMEQLILNSTSCDF